MLSSVLLKRDALEQVPDLKPEHFFSESNGRIFEAALALAEGGRPVDTVTVASWLRDRDQLIQVGGAAYLVQIVDATPAVAHVEAHASIVTMKWRRRRAIAAAQLIAAEGYGDLDGDGEESWLESLPQRLVDEQDERPDAVFIGDAMRRAGLERRELAAQGRVHLGPLTGLRDLDERTGGLRPGKVTTVAARSGVGKTAIALQTAANVAANGDGVIVFQLEAPEDECVDRLHYATAGVDGSRLLRGELLPVEDMRSLTAAAERMARSPIWVIARSNITATDIRASSGRLARTLDRNAKTKIAAAREAGVVEKDLPRPPRLALVIVDYVQLVSARDMPERAPNREAQVSHVSRNLKRLAMDLRVHVMVLAQLNKDGDRRGDDKRPRTSDLRESSAIENDSDHIVLIYNPHALARSRGERDGEPADEVELILGKNRGGRPGTIHAQWVPAHQSYRCVGGRAW